MDLLDSVREAQAQRGWNNDQLAKELHISPSVLSRILSGQRPLKVPPFLPAVAKLMPELKWQIAEFVFNGGNNGRKINSQ